MKTDIAEYFMELVSIDSESRNERHIADRIIMDLRALGAEVNEDDAYTQTGGNAGNIHAFFKGNADKSPILFCAHIDTVKPGNGIVPKLVGDRICSSGDTILGADDKSGVAEIIYGIADVLAGGEDHAPIEILFTICEEIGLLGAKSFDKTKLRAAFGYALDTQGIGEIVIGAPSQNSILISVIGKEAHAGVQPEKGINAIRVAAAALAAMPSGRIDAETTTNMGVISGGTATNIVPNRVEIKGEARSHNPKKLDQVCADIRSALEQSIQKHISDVGVASFDMKIKREYDAFYVAEGQPAVKVAVQAMDALGIEAKIQRGGGGSDANIINAAGVPMVILGTGMYAYHTVDEYIDVADLKKGAQLISQIIRMHSHG